MIDLSVLRAGVIVILALCTGGVLAVMRLHYRAWRRLPGSAGLTPLHVFLVSLGVLILQTTLAWALMESLRDRASTVATIRTSLYGLGSLIILASLLVIGGLQRRRVGFARDQQTVVVHDGESVAGVRDREQE